MIRLTSVLIVALLTCTCAFAQSDSARRDHSTKILEKIDKIDLMNQILPLLLTKDQLKKLLPSIEKARETVRSVEVKEYEALRKLEPLLDTSLSEAIEKGEVPKREELTAAFGELRKLSLGRQFVADANATNVLEVFKTVCNKGQQKTAAGSIDGRYFPAGTKIEEVGDDKRMLVFVREVLLHPLAYDVLRKMSI